MQEQLQSIYNCLSVQRMGKYQRSGVEPLDLYKWNIALSESLYPLLHIIEVALRNRLHAEIVELFNNPEWLLAKER